MVVSCRPHYWEWFPKGDWIVEIESDSTFKDLVNELAAKLPLEFTEIMEKMEREDSHYVALVNGRSISSLNQFDTRIEPDSQITFTLMLNGG